MTNPPAQRDSVSLGSKAPVMSSDLMVQVTPGAPAREMTMQEAIREALREEMRRDPTVFLLGEDIGKHGGAFGVTRTLFDEFGPERVRNTPISENTIIGAATGAALVGLRPVAEIMFIDFSGLAMDQIANQAAKLRLMTGGQCKVPWVLRMPQGGGAGKSTAAQHSQSLEVWYAHIPGLKVVLPATPYDAKGLLKSAIRDDNPVIFLEHKLLYSFKGLVPEEDYTVPLSQCDIKRTGKDVTVIASGYMVWHAMMAARQLEGRASAWRWSTCAPSARSTSSRSVIQSARPDGPCWWLKPAARMALPASGRWWSWNPRLTTCRRRSCALPAATPRFLSPTASKTGPGRGRRMWSRQFAR